MFTFNVTLFFQTQQWPLASVHQNIASADVLLPLARALRPVAGDRYTFHPVKCGALNWPQIVCRNVAVFVSCNPFPRPELRLRDEPRVLDLVRVSVDPATRLALVQPAAPHCTNGKKRARDLL